MQWQAMLDAIRMAPGTCDGEITSDNSADSFYVHHALQKGTKLRNLVYAGIHRSVRSTG